MEYNDFEKWMSENLTEFQNIMTLAGRSSFYAKYNLQDGSVTLKVNRRKGGFTDRTLEKNDIIKIFERWAKGSATNKYKSTYYQIQNWTDSPGMVEAPAIPAMIKYWVENQ